MQKINIEIDNFANINSCLSKKLVSANQSNNQSFIFHLDIE